MLKKKKTMTTKRMWERRMMRQVNLANITTITANITGTRWGGGVGVFGNGKKGKRRFIKR